MTTEKHFRFERRWLVLVGSSVLHFTTFGVVQSFGLLYSEILTQFNKGKGETGWIPSLNSSLLFGLGPVASFLEKRYGCRVVGISGSILIAAGLVSSVFVNDLYLLYLTYGIISGTGNGLILLSATEVIVQNFETHRKLALTIASAGGSLGVVVIPLLTAYWLDVYGWRGTFLMIAGLCLQGVVCAAIIPSPLTSKMKGSNKDNRDDKVSQSMMQQLKQILRSYDFLVFNLATTIVCIVYIVPFVILPDMVILKGFTTYQAASIVTTAGIAGILAKIFTGWLSEFDRINTVVIQGVWLLIGTGWNFGCAYISSSILFLVYGGFYGAYVGIFGALQSVITAEILDKELFSVGFGVLCFFHSLGFAIGPPVAGWIADASGSYNEAFFFTAALLFIGSVLSFCIPLRKYCHRNNKYDLDGGNYT